MQGERGNTAESIESAVDIFEVMQIAAEHADTHGSMSRYWTGDDGLLYIEYEDGSVQNYNR